MIEFWVSLCSHCGGVWPINYGPSRYADKHFFEHSTEVSPLAERLDWERRWREASCGLVEALQVKPSDPMYTDATWLVDYAHARRMALLEEAREKRKLCKGSGELVTGIFWLNKETCVACGLGKMGHERCSRRWIKRVRKPLIPRLAVWTVFAVSVLAAYHAAPMSGDQRIAFVMWIVALYFIAKVKR